MKYENKLICFIDLLGFQSAVHESVKNSWIRESLYDVIYHLKSDKLKKELYGSIPCFDFQDINIRKSSRDKLGGEVVPKLSPVYPLSITQFSDSFVLSCPSENNSSCALLLKLIYFIHLMYFHNLGMMVRGGVAIGDLIHEESGALFGPAMNEAYKLESKIAIYPRVVMSEKAFSHLRKV